MYRPTIGLEIHAELSTKTKMFCDSKNDSEETRPNVNVCPVCMAHPGTLPVINKEAVKYVLTVGTAIGAELADFTEFDRKSYFYPDIPKGYQISQYIYPLVVGGSLSGVKITRIHLEEDTARSTHHHNKSLVDFNRAGIPLMELVTEPVIHDAETAVKFARELQLLLRTLGISKANLEKGEMRMEANISVASISVASDTVSGDTMSDLAARSDLVSPLGTKVEVKNINSFRSLERAIEFEIKRQSALIDSGGVVVQETRGWNEGKQETFHQRLKEGSADYRYFPEPDLPKLFLSDPLFLQAQPEFSKEAIQKSLPELPGERRARYARAYALKESDIAYLSATPERARFFDAVAAELSGGQGDIRSDLAARSDLMSPELGSSVALAANYIISDLAGIQAKNISSKVKECEEIGETFPALDPKAFAKLIDLVCKGSLSSRGAKDVLVILVEKGGDPETIAQKNGLMQVHDTNELLNIVKKVLQEEEKVVLEYKAGKESVLQYLIGKTMKATKGSGNPAILKELIISEICMTNL